MKILEKFKIPDGLVNLIQDIYSNNSAKIKTEGKLSASIPVNQGIRQGDSLSPLLFNLIMNEIIEEIKNLKGYSLGDENITCVCYADDAALVAEDEDSLQRLLYKFCCVARKFGLTLSTKKTKTLTISKTPLRCKLQLYDEIVEQVMSFTYLGIQVTSHQDLEAEVKHQAIKASKISGCLNNAIWSNQYLRTEAKVRVYKTVVRPILTYAAETRPNTAKTCQILEITEMKTLRRIMNVTRLDRMRSEDVREKCGIQKVGDWIKRRKDEWHAHVERMTEDRLVKKVMTNRPVGLRSRGRPKKRWCDDLDETNQ